MKRRKYTEPFYTGMAKGMVGFGVTTGVGSAVIGGIGGSTAPTMQSAMGNLAGYAPAITSIGMGTGLMNMVKTKRRRK